MRAVTFILLLLGLLGAASATVSAERKNTEVVQRPDERPGRAPEPAPNTPGPGGATVDTGPVLRCWQFGRLILEEPVGASTVNLPGATVQLRGRGEARGAQLVDLRTATCLIR